MPTRHAEGCATTPLPSTRILATCRRALGWRRAPSYRRGCPRTRGTQQLTRACRAQVDTDDGVRKPPQIDEECAVLCAIAAAGEIADDQKGRECEQADQDSQCPQTNLEVQSFSIILSS